MDIKDIISEAGIITGISANDKNEVLKKLVALHDGCGNITDTRSFLEGIQKREAAGTTAVGNGVAVPHAKSAAVIKTGICAVTLKDGVDWGSPDGQPVKTVFMIAAGEKEGDAHLEVLASLITLLMNKKLVKRLEEAQDASEFRAILAEFAKERTNNEGDSADDTTYRLVAVTACPTGVAHTYMAAEALKKCADEMGVTIKVETMGSGGSKNRLTEDEIKNAHGVIVAADRQIDMGRFDGKRLLYVSTADAIHRGNKTVTEALSTNLPVYRRKASAEKGSHAAGSYGFKALYGYLMNGVSHMLPFVVAGGLFIAVSFLADTLSGAAENASFGTATPFSAFLNQIGGIVFSFMLPVLSGYISMAVADRPGFLPGFAGGWLASIGSTFQKPMGDISSGFLGALFAGFAAGFTMLLIEAVCDGLPQSLEGIKSVLIYPVVGLLLIALIVCGVNPVMGYINTAISHFLETLNGISAVALGAVLGAMMAFDMGGPVNKAAYVFGTASISAGNYTVMAAVMAGGMVPPLAIALATSIFAKRFSPEERKNGTVNYILGLSFITEGAIPYAASDPIRVIPACMAGSAVAGGLSMLFECTLRAPHGGIFVFPVVGGAAMYLLSVAAGSVVAALLLGALKSNYSVRGKG